MKSLNLTGEKFGRLTVVSKAETRMNKTRWNCICDCGNVGTFATGNLRVGDSKSCGCLPATNVIHGHCGTKKTRTYRIWAGLLSRCRNRAAKDYKFYGAKGITVCDRWITFANFLEDMGESVGDMTIDRIDASRGYEKSNCQWMTHSDNCRKAALGRWSKKRMTFAEAA